LSCIRVSGFSLKELDIKTAIAYAPVKIWLERLFNSLLHLLKVGFGSGLTTGAYHSLNEDLESSLH
jgi:hypothetical protein